MKTLKDIIALRGSKYASDAKNPSYTEFWQGYFDGWNNAYRDLKEILEQNGFNLDVPVIGVGNTNAQHIRSMTDEELAKFLLEIMSNSVCFGEGMFPYHPCPQDHQDCEKCGLDWLREPYKEKV